MKLRNKKTRENYDKLKPPKIYYYITEDGEMWSDEDLDGTLDLKRKHIGNYFESEEEVRKVYKKLMAWKRLKDKGFKFDGWNCALQELYFSVPDTFYDRPDMFGHAISEETTKDLDLLFGGEE